MGSIARKAILHRSRAVTELWSGLSGASRKLIGLGGLILLVMAAAVAIAVIEMREAKLNETRQGLGKLGIAIA